MSIISPSPRAVRHDPRNLYSSPAPSRKRSPAIAFSDDTPPSSRPPSRAHTKRSRAARTVAERPVWVTERDSSPRIDSRINGASTLVDVRLPSGELDAEKPVGCLMRRGGFTVLCSLGSGGEMTLRSVGGVGGLLENMGAVVYGVSLSEVLAHGFAVPIIFDRQRALTASLGLLHPLGGGRVALDAVVVLDADSRARMVLPIGWVMREQDETGNRWENLVGRVVRGLEWLREEMAERSTVDVEMAEM